MQRVVIDKIASVTANCRIPKTAHVTPHLHSKAGDVIVVRILNEKTVYDKLELLSGRLSRLKSGDIVAGALGHRAAMQGYAGDCPSELRPGSQVQMLNQGGVVGLCHGTHPVLGPPFECEVIGQALVYPTVAQRKAIPANIALNALPLQVDMPPDPPPVIAVLGTSMNSGKTGVCVSLIQTLSRRGWRIAAGKVTGVSLRRDVLAMEDAGAVTTTTFTDFGVVSTSPSNASQIARAQIANLANGQPDAILLELGDGLMGAYGLDAVLADRLLADRLSCIVLTASDPVGARGACDWLARFGLRPSVVSGPTTDNLVGIQAIERHCKLPAINARSHSSDLSDHVENTTFGDTSS